MAPRLLCSSQGDTAVLMLAASSAREYEKSCSPMGRLSWLLGGVGGHMTAYWLVCIGEEVMANEWSKDRGKLLLATFAGPYEFETGSAKTSLECSG